MKKIFIFALTFMLCFISIIPVSYADTIPEYEEYLQTVIDELPTDYYTYTVYQYSGDYRIHLAFDNSGHHDAGYEFITLYENGSVTTYLRHPDDSTNTNRQLSSYVYQYITSTQKWTRVSRIENEYKSLFGASGTILLYSTDHIYNTDGTIFFEGPPTTLAAIIQEVVDQEMVPTQGKIMETMKTILLCGVGCLALLISLVLLVKTLRRYLPR